MIKRESNFFEEHIEKIVLAAVGVVCLLLLVLFVIFSPTKVTYDNSKFTASQIDKYIFDKKASKLDYRLSREPSIVGPYESEKDDFQSLMASSIDIKTNIYPQIPPNLKDVGVQPKYKLPEMVRVEDAAVDVLSVVAYLPNGTISEDNKYSRMNSEPNDIDLVTVEARLDVEELYRRFREEFAGPKVNPEWRDTSLAEPVFAAVQLQRKEQLKNGGWSDWANVPHCKIESRKDMFQIIENVQDLPPGGIKVRLLDFRDGQVQAELLQPEAYRIASPDERWYPPTLHSRYSKYQQELERLEQINERSNETARRRTAARGGDDAGALAEGRRGYYRPGVADQATLERIREVTASINELSESFEKLAITEDTDLSEREEPMLVWAFDDTVEQKKKYRYRIRVGVFNPIAGTEKFANADNPKRNTVILWSNYAEAGEVVSVPSRLYFFARDVQKAEKAVTVTVCRKTLGYWYTKDFMVKPGEKIGKSVKLSKSEIGEVETISDMTGAYMSEIVVNPAVVDYSTGAILLDVVDVNDWAGRANLYERYYTEMLYTYDGSEIYRMPIRQDYWATELRISFSEIRQSEKEPKEPLRPWSDLRRGGRRGVTQPRQDIDRDERFRIYQQRLRQRTLGGAGQQ